MTTCSVSRGAARSLLTLAAALSLSGCGVVFGGTTKDITVVSTPTESQLTTEPVTGSFTTPATLTLQRKTPYTLVVWKEGYRETQLPLQKSIRVVPLILDLFCLVCVIVDAATGGWWDLQPEQAVVELQVLEEDSGLQPITVSLSFDADAPDQVAVEATEPVMVELREQ